MKGIWGSNGARIKFTHEGGLAVQYYNKTGAASIKGYMVSSHDTIDDSVRVTPINDFDIIGVFLDTGVPDGQLAWVVVAGRAYVYFFATTTLGGYVRNGVTADTGEVAGQAIAEALPTSPFATDKHFMEIGHCLEVRTGAGLALVNIHFN
jgi:hypothetical protein